MTIAKVVCVTKDEYDLIEDFIKYHAYLFGYENVVIVDNGSTHPEVLRVYEKYSKLGVDINYEPIFDRDKQNIIYGKYIEKNSHNCTFIFPIDTDEFIYYMPIQ